MINSIYNRPALYIISGLGADARVFDNLSLQDFEVYHLSWLQPYANEKISAYAARMANQIRHKQPILLGLSFGGIMAIEISKLIHVEKLILLSSVKTKDELPFYFSWSGRIGLANWIPLALLQKPNSLLYWFFGITEASSRQMLSEILANTNALYLRWSINAIANWNNTTIPNNILHLHGSNDRVFPISCCKQAIPIAEGGHFMVLTHALQLEELIKQYALENITEELCLC